MAGCVSRQETQISRLKASLDDAIAAQKSSLQETERLQTELQKAQQAVRVMEGEGKGARGGLGWMGRGRGLHVFYHTTNE